MGVRWTTGFLDFPSGVAEVGAGFWQAVTGSERSSRRGEHGELATLLPPSGDTYLRVRDVGDGPGGCHLDLHVDDFPTEAEYAVTLGATIVWVLDDVVMLTSPGGLPFGLVADTGPADRPPPATWQGGHRSLADQLCVDIPAASYDHETAFWETLTGWPRGSTNRAEFEYLYRPPHLPLRLLLQRLDEASAGLPCRAHIDLACDDVPAEVARHQRLGAAWVRETADWVTLRDPAGLDYCITRRSPDTGHG